MRPVGRAVRQAALFENNYPCPSVAKHFYSMVANCVVFGISLSLLGMPTRVDVGVTSRGDMLGSEKRKPAMVKYSCQRLPTATGVRFILLFLAKISVQIIIPRTNSPSFLSFGPRLPLQTQRNSRLLARGLLPAGGAAVYRLKRTGRGVVDGGDYLWQVFFDDGQLDGR